MPTLDATFRQRAAKVLWCYEHAEKLAERDELVVCLDEKSNLQAHASWLNQAELLLRAFSARYLSRGDWYGRTLPVEHLEASWREYNSMYAHPFTWSWTRHHLRQWLERQGHGLRVETYRTLH